MKSPELFQMPDMLIVVNVIYLRLVTIQLPHRNPDFQNPLVMN